MNAAFWNDAVVAVIALACAYVVGRHVVRQFKGKRDAGCSCCSGNACAGRGDASSVDRPS